MFKTRSAGRRAVLAVVAAALVISACSADDDAATTSVVPDDDVVFGSGSLPDTLPSDFPVPDEAVIGSTLVVRSTGTTEVIMRVPVELAVAVTYFEQNLPARDFTILTSEANSDAAWAMEIERDDLSGTIDFKTGAPRVTEIVMAFTSV